MRDVPLDFKSHRFGGGWNQIQSHFIHFNCDLVFLLLKINIPHVYSQPAGLRVEFAFNNFIIFDQGFLQLPVCLELTGMGQSNTVGKIQIDLIGLIWIFPQFP